MSMKVDYTINVGTMLHLALLLISAFAIWHDLDEQEALQRQNQAYMSQQLQVMDDRTQRIENWLLMHDGEYLKRRTEDIDRGRSK